MIISRSGRSMSRTRIRVMHSQLSANRVGMVRVRVYEYGVVVHCVFDVVLLVDGI